MQTIETTDKLDAEHGVICSLPQDYFGYFGWPSVTREEDGTLYAAASGLRHQHVCPYGRTVLWKSGDDGRTWSSPRVVNDTPLDDRDAGILALDGKQLLISWFTSDTRYFAEKWEWGVDGPPAAWAAGLRWMTEENVAAYLGSWVRRSRDGGESWEAPVRVPVSAPHGPIRLRNGSLLYLGKVMGNQHMDSTEDPIMACASTDGERWSALGTVPRYAGTQYANYHEPHVVELPSGVLLGLIRVENAAGADLQQSGVPSFSMMQTRSTDGGYTWSTPEPLGFHGSPPHLLRHSSGALVCVYGYRQEPYGQRIAISRDDGESWTYDYILRDDGPSGDLGYPCSVELGDSSLFTVYYQQCAAGEKCSVLWSRWRLPG